MPNIPKTMRKQKEAYIFDKQQSFNKYDSEHIITKHLNFRHRQTSTPPPLPLYAVYTNTDHGDHGERFK